MISGDGDYLLVLKLSEVYFNAPNMKVINQLVGMKSYQKSVQKYSTNQSISSVKIELSSSGPWFTGISAEP